MDPITIALMSAGTLLGGFGALSKSPQEERAEKALGRLDANQGWLESTPYSKEEVMQYLIPKLQKIQRGAADVVASKVGAAAGEMDNANFMEYYTQALGEVIGQGEQAAAGIEADMNKWFAQLDDNAKTRFLQSIQLELQGSSQLSSMTQLQKGLTSALAGINLGATAGANITTADALLKQATTTGDTINTLYSKGLDIGTLSNNAIGKGQINVQEEMRKYLKGGSN